MASLTSRAIEKLSVKDIWEKGVLNAPLPPQTLDRLYNKITLQNLYNENLLTNDMDLDLFALALEKSAPGFLWPYINKIFETDIYSKESPLSEEGENFIASNLEVVPENFDTFRNVALQNFLNDLILYISTELDLPHRYVNNIFVSSRFEDGSWKLLIINSKITLKTLKKDPPTKVNIFNTLDELLFTIYGELESYFSEGSIIKLVQNLANPADPDFELVDPTTEIALNGMRTALKVDPRKLWDKLETGEAILTGDFSFSFRFLKRGSRLTVMGEYLYIVMTNKSGTNFVNFTRDSGLALLTTFFLPDNLWKLKNLK